MPSGAMQSFAEKDSEQTLGSWIWACENTEGKKRSIYLLVNLQFIPRINLEKIVGTVAGDASQ